MCDLQHNGVLHNGADKREDKHCNYPLNKSPVVEKQTTEQFRRSKLNIDTRSHQYTIQSHQYTMQGVDKTIHHTHDHIRGESCSEWQLFFLRKSDLFQRQFNQTNDLDCAG